MKNWFYIVLSKIHRLTQRLLQFQTIGVKGVVINAQHEVLLVEHTYMDGWHIPGGGVEPGETPKAAVIRELAEEGGVIVKPSDLMLFAVYSNQISGASDYPILYIAKAYEPHPNPIPSPEIKQAQWFPLNNLPEGTTPKTRKRLAEVIQTLKPDEYW